MCNMQIQDILPNYVSGAVTGICLKCHTLLLKLVIKLVIYDNYFKGRDHACTRCTKLQQLHEVASSFSRPIG